MDLYELLNAEADKQTDTLPDSLFSEINKQKIDKPEDKAVFDLLGNLFSLRMQLVDKDVQFHPFLRAFSLDSLTEQDYKTLESLDISRIPMFVKARIADILWTRRKKYKYGIIAAESYLDIYKYHISQNELYESLDFIRRAICISTQIGKTDLYDKACQCLFDDVLKKDGTDDGFYSLRAIEEIVEYGFGDSSKIIVILDKIISNNAANLAKTEQAYQIKIRHLQKRHQIDDARNMSLKLAEYYADYANHSLGDHMQGAMRAAVFLEKAVHICRNNGFSERANELHRRLIEVQRIIPTQMTPMPIKIDFGKYKTVMDANMEGLSFAECVFRLGQFVGFANQDELRKEVLQSVKDDPLSFLFSKTVIDTNGQTVLSLHQLDRKAPETDPQLELYMHQKMLEREKIIGDIWVGYLLHIIREKYSFTEEDLEFITKNNPIIPAGRDHIIRKAIYLALKGDFYEALHIFAPQIENIFRNIAKEVGAVTVTLEDDGTSKQKVLSSIFDLPELVESYDDDILFTFKGLLNEKAGANIRNKIAHGLVEEKEAHGGVYLFFIASVIKLLLYTSPEAYAIYKNNVKLKMFKKTDVLENDNKMKSVCDE
ncbi:DUF4209 domain-containing protein [Clostridiales bacterium FE2010]|nr:DUF4209 domain-containing protein [Clostridiales bacterium FE2010]